MKKLLLQDIRLSWYLIILIAVFLFLKVVIPEQVLTRDVLTLFSVNSLLYGFYIAPILAGQKARIEELHKIVRNEANALFSMLLDTQKLSEKTKNELQDMFMNYARSIVREKRAGQGEEEYEELITYCLKYKGKDKDEVTKILDKLVTNQANRTQFNMQFRNSVYSNEWIIMLVLFSITISFILAINTGGLHVLDVTAAFLCAGLAMLLLVLLKLSTLTHKKARQIWNPIVKLIETKFYRFD